MQLSQLAAKPQLMKLVLDDEETIAEYNEAIEFWTWDRQPLETFMKLANTSQADSSGMIEVIRTLILDEHGKPLITGDQMLPSKVLLRSITKIVEALGK
jgi:deoxyhypusine synthase